MAVNIENCYRSRMLCHVWDYLPLCLALSLLICPYWNSIWKTSQCFSRKPQFLRWTNSKVRFSIHQRLGVFCHCYSLEAETEVFCFRVRARLCMCALTPINTCAWKKVHPFYFITSALNQTHLDWGCKRFRIVTNIMHLIVMVFHQTSPMIWLRSRSLLHNVPYSYLHAVNQFLIWSRLLMVLFKCVLSHTLSPTSANTQAIPVKLPWIFTGAPLIFNGAPGNIQGSLDTCDRTQISNRSRYPHLRCFRIPCLSKSNSSKYFVYLCTKITWMNKCTHH